MDEACDRFEADWRAGQAPRIEDYLDAAAEADRAALLGELVALERELRRRRGDRPGAQEYLDRFPGHAGVIRSAFDEEHAPDSFTDGRRATSAATSCSGLSDEVAWGWCIGPATAGAARSSP